MREHSRRALTPPGISLSGEARFFAAGLICAALYSLRFVLAYVNARGELFETEALIEGIESCKIGSLAMDVFEGEDGIYHVDLTDDIVRNRDMAYLRQFPNVVLTQHMAFYTQLSMDSMIENSVQGLVDFNESGASRYEIKY